jgi:CRISPR-associated protein (TIGR03986 family)
MIPGTTLKGMLRNHVEILSFGKMGRVDNHRYGVRDLQNPNLYGKYLTVDVGGRTYKPLSMAGWLSVDGETEDWKLEPCSYARVDHRLLNNPRLHGRQSALMKYEVWGRTRLKVSFDCTGEMPHAHSGGKKLVYRKVTKLNGGATPGTLVFTGQPAPNDGRPGKKHMEFIFFNEQKDKKIPVPKAIGREFQFIHSDANEVPNEEWAYWKKELSKGQKVPVFYLTNKDGSLHSIGLAMMYRLPYANSVRQAIEHTSSDHFHPDPDLAETIFGFVNGNTDSLKGRVAISPAIATHAEKGSKVQTVLGGPKPSFYPNYIEQPNPSAQYKTFMDSDCRIRGWKRYPVRLTDAVEVPKGVTNNVDTCLIPLREGAKFVFRVKYHNLKPVELGAVVWAMTWGNDRDRRHSLGMGKSMGYGSVSIAITEAAVDWQGCMNEFVTLMNREVGGDWLKTAQLEQLLAMANPKTPPQCGELKHLFLAPGAGNEFVNAKKAKLRLEPHVKPTATSDDERFRNLKPRPTEKGQTKEQAEVSAVAPETAKIETVGETWTKVRLGYNRGQKILSAQASDGRKAEVQLIGSSVDLVSEEVLNALAKGKNVEAQIEVEKLGPKWRITGFKRL